MLAPITCLDRAIYTNKSWIALARGGTFCASPSNRGTVETGSLVDVALPRRSPVRLALTHIGFFRTSSVYAGYAAAAYDLTVKSCIIWRTNAVVPINTVTSVVAFPFKTAKCLFAFFAKVMFIALALIWVF